MRLCRLPFRRERRQQAADAPHRREDGGERGGQGEPDMQTAGDTGRFPQEAQQFCGFAVFVLLRHPAQLAFADVLHGSFCRRTEGLTHEQQQKEQQP